MHFSLLWGNYVSRREAKLKQLFLIFEAVLPDIKNPRGTQDFLKFFTGDVILYCHGEMFPEKHFVVDVLDQIVGPDIQLGLGLIHKNKDKVFLSIDQTNAGVFGHLGDEFLKHPGSSVLDGSIAEQG